MNTHLHIATYTLNPKWYVSRNRRIIPIEDPKAKKGFELPLERSISQKKGEQLGGSGCNL